MKPNLRAPVLLSFFTLLAGCKPGTPSGGIKTEATKEAHETSTCSGDVLVSSQNDIDSAAKCKSVNGRLTIDITQPIESISIPFATVTGTIAVAPTSRARTILLPNLVSVGEGLLILDNHHIERLGAHALTDVGSHFLINRSQSISQIDAPKLEKVGGGLGISTLPSLTSLNFESIKNIGDSIIIDNTGVSRASFSSLTTISGGVMVVHNNRLKEVLIPSLVSVLGGEFFLGDNANLSSVVAPMFSRVAGNFLIADNGNLPQSDANRLAHQTQSICKCQNNKPNPKR